jgi:hypothetical protein
MKPRPEHLASFIRPQDGTFSQFRNALGMLLASKEVIPPESISGRLLMEAMSRLSQLDYLHAQTTTAEDIVGRLVGNPAGAFPAVAGTIRQAMFKCHLYAETFYLFAFRIVDITRHVNKELCGVKEICTEPKGVRDVRNWLIVHQAKKQPVLNRSFDVSMADGRGVVLKSQRLPDEGADPVDAGFRSNTAEFQRFVHRWIAEMGSSLGVFKDP